MGEREEFHAAASAMLQLLKLFRGCHRHERLDRFRHCVVRELSEPPRRRDDATTRRRDDAERQTVDQWAAPGALSGAAGQTHG
jgi:hypothetical protein